MSLLKGLGATLINHRTIVDSRYVTHLEFLTDRRAALVESPKSLPACDAIGSFTTRTVSQDAAISRMSDALRDGDVYALLSGAADERKVVLRQSFELVHALRRCVYIDTPMLFVEKTILDLKRSMEQASLVPSTSSKRMTLFIDNIDDAPTCFLEFLEEASSDQTTSIGQTIVGSSGLLLDRLNTLQLRNFERRLALRCSLSKVAAY